MNMGVADGVDLGWKLAAVLRGWGGAELLASYEKERRPVHQYVMDEAVANHAVLGSQLTRAGIEADDAAGARLRAEIGATIAEAKIREFKTLGVVLGCNYRGSPIVIDDGSLAQPAAVSQFTPSSCPGNLAPHAWMDDGSSLYDGFDQGFTLLVLADEDADDVARAEADARRAGIPLATFKPRTATVHALYQTRMALIRPDQHVAWRGDSWPVGGSDLLERVCGH